MNIEYIINCINKYKSCFSEIKYRLDDKTYDLIDELISTVEYMKKEYEDLEEQMIEEKSVEEWVDELFRKSK